MKRGVPTRGLLLNLGLSLTVSGLLLVVLEGGARLVEKRRPPRAPSPVADYIWDWDQKMPGGFYVMKSDGIGWPPWEEFNGDGLRDRTRSHEKGDLVTRVAVLGDSVTLGAQIRPEQAFPERLEARLQAEGRPVEVMNVALWGWSTRQERIAWERIARRYHPDAVILAVCLNDIPELFNNLERPPHWLTALHERSALVRLIVNAKGREIDNVERLFTDSRSKRVRQAFARFFEEVRALRREVESDGATLSVIVFPFRFQVEPGAPAPTAQELIIGFCRDEDLRCVDLLPTLVPLGDGAFVDYDHLSPAGAAATAAEILRSGLLPNPPSARERLQQAFAREPEAGKPVLAWLDSKGQALPPPGALALAAVLSAGDAPARRAAAWALARAGEGAAPALPALVSSLRHDPSTSVRRAAATALGALGPVARPAGFRAVRRPGRPERVRTPRGSAGPFAPAARPGGSAEAARGPRQPRRLRVGVRGLDARQPRRGSTAGGAGAGAGAGTGAYECRRVCRAGADRPCGGRGGSSAARGAQEPRRGSPLAGGPDPGSDRTCCPGRLCAAGGGAHGRERGGSPACGPRPGTHRRPGSSRGGAGAAAGDRRRGQGGTPRGEGGAGARPLKTRVRSGAC